MVDVFIPQLQLESHYFANHLKELRQRLLGKQICLSRSVGCTDAAVSFWEAGRRLPQEGTLSRILEVLAKYGASAAELKNLRCSWQKARITPVDGTR